MDQNIKQMTNYDISSLPTISEEIIIGGQSISYNYKEIVFTGNVTKLGYCCEVKGIGYPIFLTFQDNIKKLFEIGKTEMFEFQKEQWQNINGENPEEEQTAIVYCTKVEVPEGIKFTLDYVVEQ